MWRVLGCERRRWMRMEGIVEEEAEGMEVEGMVQEVEGMDAEGIVQEAEGMDAEGMIG